MEKVQMGAPMTDHYTLLGVARDADDLAIRRSFRLLASKLHPDKGGDAEAMGAVNVAYEILSDPDKRAAYDRSLRAVIVAPPVSASDFEEAKTLAPWLDNGACGFCDGAREVRIQAKGFWTRKACPVCV
jgi:curved DNA-binding protein CbpA